jgi:general stress protein YciG
MSKFRAKRKTAEIAAKGHSRACFVLDHETATQHGTAVLSLHFSNPGRRSFMATSKRGFASMDPSKQREIASKGGRAAHAKGTAHEFTSDEARVAGRKGGEAVSRDRAHMAAIGREGGHSRGARARAAAAGTGAAIGLAAGAAIGAGAAYAASHRGNDRDTTTDVSQGTGSQPFVRQANEERSGFESTSNRSSSGNSGFGSSNDRLDDDRNRRF